MDAELKDVVRDVLVAICSGVAEARALSPQVSPVVSKYATNDTQKTAVDFDLAVTVTEGASAINDGKKGFSINVFDSKTGIDIKGEKTKSSELSSSTVSRIKFSVPIYLQYDKNHVAQSGSKQPFADT